MSGFNKKSGLAGLLFRFSALELVRNRLGFLLLFLIPALFLAVVEGTTGEGVLPIKIYGLGSMEQHVLSARLISLVFMAAAVSGFLTSYYALLLFHQDFQFYRYCISMRLSPRTLVLSRFGFFFALVSVLAGFILLILGFMMPVRMVPAAFAGFVLLGIVYGAYGGIVGLVSKDFMVGIMLIVLLANLDAGWLQNPVFYSSAQQAAFIHWLPAFFPCQFLFSALFAGKVNLWALFMSVVYAAVFILLLSVCLHQKIRGVYHGNRHKILS